MLTFLAPIALTLAQAAGPAGPAAQLPPLSLEQGSALRCAVAFGLVHKGQRVDDPAMTAYPVMAQRGQEFFVRTTARLMDELDADRDTIMALVMRETGALSAEPARLAEVMPPCLLMLDASGV